MMEQFLVVLAWYLVGFFGVFTYAYYDIMRDRKLGKEIGFYGTDLLVCLFLALFGPIVPSILWTIALFGLVKTALDPFLKIKFF
jgi:hypothetical protein